MILSYPHSRDTYMKVLIFGNEIYQPDSLPLRLLPELKKIFPKIDFVCADPNEEWDVDGSVVAIDTIMNAEEPVIFESLEMFEEAPRVSMHDFDALAQLRLLQKIKRVKTVKILGLPPNIDKCKALSWLREKLA